MRLGDTDAALAKVLTDALCKAAQAKGGKRTEIVDVRCPGLALRITADGIKSWNFRFRDPAAGPKANPQRMMLGRYPDVTLSDARAKARKHREAVAAGKNPITMKAQERQDAPKLTYDYLADRYMTEHARRHKRPRSADEDDRNLKNHILPKWAKRKYREITRADVVELLEGIIAAGFQTAANRVQALISKIFSFGIDIGLLDANPAARLQKRGKESAGERVLDDAEIKLFWHKIIHQPVTYRTGIALRLALLTGCRANEIVGLRRSEIDHLQDPKRRAWTVPGSRTKNKRPHLVPLTTQAWNLIATLFDLVDEGRDCLFPSPKNADQPIGRHCLAVATKRFCKVMEGRKPRWTGPTFSPHDLRRTFSTKLSSLGVLKEDRSACLNHTRSDVDARHYDRYERAAEKRAALQKVSDEISRLIKDRRG